MDLLEKLRKKTVKAIADYKMLRAGDRVLIAMSGGKDSSMLLILLEEIRKRSPFEFSIHPVMVDQALPGFNPAPIEKWVAEHGYSLEIIPTQIYTAVQETMNPGSSPCGLCSRFRRRVLYNHAQKKSYTKIALGHHRDDLNETLLMSMFFAGEIAGMPPVLRSDDQQNCLIRPMCFLEESWIQKCSEELEIPTVSCDACGFWDGMQRAEMKRMLGDLEEKYPGLNQRLAASQKNIRTAKLSDPRLWDKFPC